MMPQFAGAKLHHIFRIHKFFDCFVQCVRKQALSRWIRARLSPLISPRGKGQSFFCRPFVLLLMGSHLPAVPSRTTRIVAPQKKSAAPGATTASARRLGAWDGGHTLCSVGIRWAWWLYATTPCHPRRRDGVRERRTHAGGIRSTKPLPRGATLP